MKSISATAQNPPGTHLAGGNGRPAEGSFTYKSSSSPYWFEFFSDGRTPLTGVRLSPSSFSLPSAPSLFTSVMLTRYLRHTHTGEDPAGSRGRIQSARRARDELVGAVPGRLRERDHGGHDVGLEDPHLARQRVRAGRAEPLLRPREQARRDRVPLRAHGRGRGPFVPGHQLRRFLERGACARGLGPVEMSMTFFEAWGGADDLLTRAS